MSILAFGDLHLTKDPLRIISVLNFLDYIGDYAKKNNIKHIVNLGDLFDRPESNSNAFVPVFRKLLELSKIASIYSIIGNHELKDKFGNDTLVETFSSFGTFIQNNSTINIDGVDCDFLSYTENPQDIPNKGRILFGHLEVDGFFFNPKKQVEGSMFSPELFDNYELVVSGHLHHEQHKNNFEFIGSPYPTNRGEGNKKNYFAVIRDTACELVEYNDGPDYITILAENFNENINYTNKIVTVQLTKKVENFVKLRDILFEKGALEVLPEFIKEEIVDTNEHKIDTNEGVIKSAARYLQEVKAPEIDNNFLLKCFKEVLKRC
jgi:DNA repair exonuclease SbcCD nuclease subunit